MADNQQKEELSAAEKSLSRQDPPPTLLSWGVRAVSLLLLLGVIGYFIYLSLQPDGPPAFELTMDTEKIESRNGSWVLPVTVLNSGDKCVLALSVAAAMTGSQSNNSTANVGLLGTREEITVEFWFDAEPSEENVELSVVSYVLP